MLKCGKAIFSRSIFPIEGNASEATNASYPRSRIMADSRRSLKRFSRCVQSSANRTMPASGPAPDLVLTCMSAGEWVLLAGNVAAGLIDAERYGLCDSAIAT